MNRTLATTAAAFSVLVSSCGSHTPIEPDEPLGTRLVRETLTGTISATTSPACSAAFRQSVHPTYYSGGTGRCVEYTYLSRTAGPITARLTWEDRRLDLDLVLNDTAGSNYRQSIAANRGAETIDFVINRGTNYAFVVYLRGIDELLRSSGGQFNGEVATPFTLIVERPE